jgi:catechol 2,3-dioxygenase-like lactoylglutathione lyase family enzyme
MFLPKFRIALRVRNADKSATFYEALLGAKPAHRTAGTALFEVDSPPLFGTPPSRSAAPAPACASRTAASR